MRWPRSAVRAGRRSPPEVRTSRPSAIRLSRQRVALRGVRPRGVQAAAVHRPIGCRGARPAAGRGTAGRCPPRSAPSGAARRTPGGRPRARRTGRRPGSARSAGCAAVQTRAPSSIDGHRPGGGGRPRPRAAATSARARSAWVTDGGRELRAGQRAREHPAHVGVEHDVAPAVGEGRDRGSGVVADAGEREQVVVGRRHLAAVPLDDRRGRGVQPQRPARVAEAAPGPDRLARRAPRPGRPASASCAATPRAPAAPGRPASAGA